MAFTFGKMPLRVSAPNDAYLASVSKYFPEASGQSFKKNCPVQFNSGYIEECASPIVTSTLEPVLGICLEDATGTQGSYLRVVTPFGGSLGFFATFLGSAAADNVLAAADLGATFQVAKSTTLLGASAPGWYLLDTATNGGATMISFESDYPAPTNQSTTRAAAGDTNARVECVFKAAVLQIFL